MEIIGILTGFVKPIFEGIFRWKEGTDQITIKKMEYETMMKDMENQFKLRLQQELRKPDSELRAFMLDYEGKASEMPKIIQILRASVRPLVTYWSLIILTALMFGWVDSAKLSINLENIPQEIWWIFLSIFGFWFGGRAIQQIAGTWKEGDVKKEEAKKQTKESDVKAIVKEAIKETKKEDTSFSEDELAILDRR